MQLQEYIDNGLVHEVHTSEVKSFKACRRRWDWITRQHFYPKVTQNYFEFGIAYHMAMETFYDPKTWGLPRHAMAQLAVQTFWTEHDRQKNATKESLGVYELDPELEQDYDNRRELGIGMLQYYLEQVAPKLDQGWTPQAVEIGFKVPIPHPYTGETIWCRCDECWDKYYKWSQTLQPPEPSTGPHGPHGVHEHPLKVRDQKSARKMWMGLPVVYAGRLDILELDSNGNLWIHDWKTAAQIREDTEYLELDDQIARYCWALWKLGYNVVGFVYHQQRKAFPEPPTENKQRRLGRLFSVNKTQNTDYETFLNTVSQFDTETHQQGLYDEFLQYLKEEGIIYYRRYAVYKSEAQIASAEHNIGLEVLDMLGSPRIYPSTGRFSCNSCAFRQPCIEKDDGGDYHYALETMFDKKDHYYVRQRPSTESKGGE